MTKKIRPKPSEKAIRLREEDEKKQKDTRVADSKKKHEGAQKWERNLYKEGR